MTSKLVTVLLAITFQISVFAQENRSAQLDAFFKKAEKNGYSGSVLVSKGDQILLSKGYGMQDREAGKKQTDQTVFSVGSITKQFTGAAILKLQDMGKLSVSDPLSKFFPAAPADKKEITIHQCLTHSAGLPDAFGDDYEQVNATDFMQLVFENKLLSPPGEQYAYSNVGYSILGIIIEKVSGKGYEQFLREQLWLPAGMEHTGYLAPGFQPADLAVGYRNGQRWGTAIDHPWMADGPGWHLRANGGVLSTVGDMHRWYKALQSNVILSEKSRNQYFTPHVSETPDEDGTHYGYGWVIDKDPGLGRFIWHNGGNGVYNAYMGFAPEAKICVVLTSNSNDKITDDYAQTVLRILNGVYKPLKNEQVQAWSGKYKLPDGSVFTARFDELDNLIVNADAPGLFKIFISNGDEDPAAMNTQTQKVQSMMEQLLAGNYQPFADARKVPEPVVRRNQSEIWTENQKQRGKVLQIEALGTADRPRFKASLTTLKFHFEKETRCLTFIWRDGVLDDIRDEAILEKDFESKGNAQFFAPNNRQTILFNANNTVSILQGNKETQAIKM
jgi:CubicO group peptidase (beta-lactamase class C family)